jgi:NitT/TauT family transport system permease protein
MRPTATRTGRALLGLGAVLAVWEAASRTELVASRYLSPPTLVAAWLGQLMTDASFLADAVSTALSWAIAVLCATVIGVGGGLLVGSVPVLRALLTPVVELLRPLPSVALIPLAVVVLGSGAQVKITVAAFAATWLVLINTLHGLHTVDPAHADTARVFRVPRFQVLWGVTLPAITPAVLTGIRLATSVAVIVVVGTEFLAGGTIGLGEFAYLQGSAAGRMDLVLATTVLVTVANLAVDLALLALRRRFMPWIERTELSA